MQLLLLQVSPECLHVSSWVGCRCFTISCACLCTFRDPLLTSSRCEESSRPQLLLRGAGGGGLSSWDRPSVFLFISLRPALFLSLKVAAFKCDTGDGWVWTQPQTGVRGPGSSEVSSFAFCLHRDCTPEVWRQWNKSVFLHKKKKNKKDLIKRSARPSGLSKCVLHPRGNTGTSHIEYSRSIWQTFGTRMQICSLFSSIPTELTHIHAWQWFTVLNEASERTSSSKKNLIYTFLSLITSMAA